MTNATNEVSVKQKRHEFGDNLGTIFHISQYKHMLWVFIRIASLGEAILMSTHNICFYVEMFDFIWQGDKRYQDLKVQYK